MTLAWTLAGATATGKSAAAQLLAERLEIAILSADAMLVYRGMDIGTAKPSAAERARVTYFGVDLVTPDQPFSTGAWLREAARAVAHTNAADSDGKAVPSLLVVGGTGLYFKALTRGLDSAMADPARRAHWQARLETEGVGALREALAALDPQALASLSDPSNPRRLIRAIEQLESLRSLPQNWKQPAPDAPLTVLRMPREQLHRRIRTRVEAMFAQGLVEEVRSLRRHYPVWSASAAQAIGYAESCALLDGTLSQAEAFERIVIRTRQLAKRQETWFRHQTQAVWIDTDERDPPERIAERILKAWRQHGATPLPF
ncbi:MAG TPA: tRNA (adenosine(37)-N6)-dimethylallyltransferase MiaA [Kiritimatiellia bacterium]|jgi:tRNA dimethylallyltransferase|nr:tRNA (adenosine(37)-N6)-dimethylallyltransferase MiaA [Kiritimatiellia bacterium]HOM58522.1 tRNA (adenosine(37)-N6)-dimethylallyltransferase MiaA [Kiritimatiellia bacterium]HOR97203.1 tRNA (adenosine(37)-N6)-dimethylallyltransferase MiaA [Kiritimatiellia bacterium]HPK37466.1 tRNA (adenosine(37)-N6)-dimethylallyltransferase MiaA [Kiritimatiellia bacterium]HPW75697.1 tRNA (adenosine(37)-N6)-dimethylallyltransferase MiaA [Kiritimatiellia bacterium]